MATIEELAVEIATLRRAIEIAASGPCDMRLDGQYSDAEVKIQPRDLAEEVRGKRMSQCSSAALMSLAGFWDWAAAKEEKEGAEYNGKPSAPGTRKRAALARGWALAKILGLKPDAPAGRSQAPAQRPPAAPPAYRPPPPPQPPAYGTSGSGASAKHTAPPEDFYDSPPGDDEIPFLSVGDARQFRPRWERW